MQFQFMNCMFCLVRLYNRLFYKKLIKQKVSSLKVPWLWVGAELMNGKIETLTEIVNSSVEYDDVITPLFLEELTELQNVKRWMYLDSTTLNEQEIPAIGLVIKDDSDK